MIGSRNGKGMRVLLADDQAQVRSALRLVLELEPGLKVVGEAAGAKELLTKAEATCPNLVLLDWELPGLKAANCSTKSGQSLLNALRERCPLLKVIALSGRPESRRMALTAGVDVFISKGEPPDQLLAAVSDFNRRHAESTRKEGEACVDASKFVKV
jgi:DNA-binding NarL/FixJ family response regulator